MTSRTIRWGWWLSVPVIVACSDAPADASEDTDTSGATSSEGTDAVTTSTASESADTTASSDTATSSNTTGTETTSSESDSSTTEGLCPAAVFGDGQFGAACFSR